MSTEGSSALRFPAELSAALSAAGPLDAAAGGASSPLAVLLSSAGAVLLSGFFFFLTIALRSFTGAFGSIRGAPSPASALVLAPSSASLMASFSAALSLPAAEPA